MSTDLDGATVVERHWPSDQPATPASMVEAAWAVDALLRWLNHATQRTAQLGSPTEVCGALAGLDDATGKLPQLCDQLVRWTSELVEDEGLRHDAHRGSGWEAVHKAVSTAGDAAMMLQEARRHAEQMHGALACAHNDIAHLYREDDA